MPENLIDRKSLPRGEELRVALEPYRGRHYLSVRRWWLDGTELKPGKGVNMHVADLPWLLRALRLAEQAAIEKGLLDLCDYEVIGAAIPPELGR